MLRFLSRLIGLLILAAGFAALVIDGTRSIAGSRIYVTPVSLLFGAKLPVMQQAIVRNAHPLLWDPVMTSLLRLPIWLALAVVGLLFLRMAQRRAPTIGYSSRA